MEFRTLHGFPLATVLRLASNKVRHKRLALSSCFGSSLLPSPDISLSSAPGRHAGSSLSLDKFYGTCTPHGQTNSMAPTETKDGSANSGAEPKDPYQT